MIETKQIRRYRTKYIKSTPDLIGEKVTVCGWVRTHRAQKTFSFVELNDGSEVSNLQIIMDQKIPEYESMIQKIATGASISVTGTVTESPGKGQSVEISAESFKVIGEAPTDYILQKKRHSFEFLRTIAHLRPRTNTFGAVTRVRSQMAYATHKFFQGRDFAYVQTPIITSADCETHGEMFHVTTLDKNKVPKTEDGKVDYSKDFFEKETFLTVSGQLNGEAYATALRDIYTFGPTFRAENSNTSRHLAEFWMIEPEFTFADLDDNMDLAEDYLKYLVKHAIDHCGSDLEFFNKFIDKTLLERLSLVLETPCTRLSYTDAIEILLKSGKKFEFPVSWGVDLSSEHERYLCEEHFKGPVILYNYPKEIKPFYMRKNDDGKTVAAMDVLVPGVGELMGGSQREERLDVLLKNLEEANLPLETYNWYVDLRRYGTTPHAGFGLGFERLVQYVTGMENIRDVIAFPRYPKHAEY
ncbi:MAG: Asparagine--tRNA ligase [Chlamydiia bacterium]|nr:Asparagine--tRNA ligase [Chlamydiia bacterium]